MQAREHGQRLGDFARELVQLALRGEPQRVQAAARDQSKVQFTHPRDIDNPYAPLTENDRCVLRGQEDGARMRIVRTLLDRA